MPVCVFEQNSSAILFCELTNIRLPVGLYSTRLFAAAVDVVVVAVVVIVYVVDKPRFSLLCYELVNGNKYIILCVCSLSLLLLQGERGDGLLGQQGSLRRRHRHTVRACHGPQGNVDDKESLLMNRGVSCHTC